MNHPDCTIYELPQHITGDDGKLKANPEWLELRRGFLTASNFGPWLLKSDKTSDKAREKAICDLIAQTAGAWEAPNFENAAMQRGTELEPEAVAAFQDATGLAVMDVGFCRSLHGLFGCSPDGLIEGQNVGLEGKVPLPGTHIKYRRAGELPEEYRFQVHGSMAVTGASSWWFQSYNPGLAPFRIEVKRDQFTEDLFGALKAFSMQLELALAEEAEAWRMAFGERKEAA